MMSLIIPFVNHSNKQFQLISPLSLEKNRKSHRAKIGWIARSDCKLSSQHINMPSSRPEVFGSFPLAVLDDAMMHVLISYILYRISHFEVFGDAKYNFCSCGYTLAIWKLPVFQFVENRVDSSLGRFLHHGWYLPAISYRFSRLSCVHSDQRVFSSNVTSTNVPSHPHYHFIKVKTQWQIYNQNT